MADGTLLADIITASVSVGTAIGCVTVGIYQRGRKREADDQKIEALSQKIDKLSKKLERIQRAVEEQGQETASLERQVEEQHRLLRESHLEMEKIETDLLAHRRTPRLKGRRASSR